MAKKVEIPEPIIPNDSWKIVELGKYVNIVNGYPFDSKRFTNSQENTYPLIRIRDVVRGYTETFTNEDCPDEYKIKSGEILIGMDGDFNIAKWKSDIGLLNQRVCKISSNSSELDENFLFFYLPIPLKQINDATPSVTVKHLSSTSLQKLHFPLPTLAEQQRIVNRIETMFAKLDQAQEKAQTVLDSFETRKAAILHKAFTGELTANWRKANGVSDDSWEEKTIGEICLVKGGKRVPKGMSLVKEKNEHPYLKAGNLKLGTVIDKDMEYVPNDVLKII
ncbi:MAG: restriction endonuclease subunit S, partial [Treponema sp.]|nr:restriction endonuclease subunit S [Treponema sp.]